jgi:hypothetical protein
MTTCMAERADVLMATFAQRGQARQAVEDLLDAGFLNVQSDVEGSRTVVILNTQGRAREALDIVARHGGVPE